MRRFLFILLHFGLPCLLFAQNPSLVEECTISSNSELVHNGRRHKTYEITSGDNLVFEHSSNNAGDPGNGSIANTKLSFQVPIGLESFDYRDSQLNECGPIYVQFCLCPDEGISKIEKGSIVGEKQDDGTWLVHIDAIAYGRKTHFPYHFKKSLIYKLAKD